jgi:hypothetical protein
MIEGDETADSYKTTADLLLSKKGERIKIISYLFKAASLYTQENHDKAIECLDSIHDNIKGSTMEFGMVQYFRFLYRLGKYYEDLLEDAKAADIYAELAKEMLRLKERLEDDKIYSSLQILKKFAAYLAKALILYDTEEKYDVILKLARTYYKKFPILQHIDVLHGELFICYEKIINAADMTGSRYFREYYAGLDNDLRGIPTLYEEEQDKDQKGPYKQSV